MSKNGPAITMALLALCTTACTSVERGNLSAALAATPGECNVVGDGTNTLFVVDLADTDPSTNASLVGALGVADVEAIANDPIDGTLYGANAGALGVIDVDTGAFTARPQLVGTGRGALGNIPLSDIDGLAFDPCSGRLYGSHRDPFGPDLLLQIDRASGARVADAFGAGVDYVVLDPVAGLEDVDDIAIDPTSCQMVAVANGGAADRLVLVDERTGDTTDVGPMGIIDVEGLAFDASGRLFGSTGVFAAVAGIYDIDKTTGTASGVRPLSGSNDYEALACMVDNDTDNDGIPDVGEAALGTDPMDADSDDDGVADGAEAGLRLDVDGDGLTSALDPDSDNDGIADGTEVGVTSGGPDTDLSARNFVADADPSTTTDPLDADTDNGGVSDGAEDVNRDGAIGATETDPNNGGDDVAGADTDGDGLSDAEEARIRSNPLDADSDDDGVLDGDEANAGFDTDRDGLINVLDADSDDDRLPDGTESGIASPGADTDVGTGSFVADRDPTTTTFPLVADSDRGGVGDGTEDTNKDGAVDAAEIDPRERRDDRPFADSDSDGLSDLEETRLGSDETDADSDDDGVLDGDESNGSLDTDLDGLLNILDGDSDADGLGDGTERGVVTAHPDTNAGAGNFTVDADPSATTSMVDADSDDGGVSDGVEDVNLNGRVDGAERDPNNPADDMPGAGDLDGDGVSDDADNCPQTANPDQSDVDGDGIGDACEGLEVGGGGCSSAPGTPTGALVLLLCMLGWRRRKPA